ncbi:MAG: FecR domain-containing protein [bacterium]|nr:MAG: FecR domain-containing protein [bacterium]
MKNSHEWDLILKYLENSLSSTEREKLYKWIRSDQQNQKTLQNIQKIWNTPEIELPEPRLELAWQKCIQAAGIETDSVPQDRPLRFPEKNSFILHNNWSKKIWRYAAVILVLILIPFIFSLFTETPPLKELHVLKAQKMEVTLSDGTRINLDAGSTLRYPEIFTAQVRQVYLSGEGYFEVTPNPDQPFIVKTDNALIRVLGTKFNVRSWHKNLDPRVTVAVLEGNVSLRAENQPRASRKVIISAGQISELLPNEAPSLPRPANILKYISWLDREMHFENAPLGEVLDQLERWYDRDIFLPDSALVHNRVTLFIEDKPLTETLQKIAMMNNLTLEEENDKFIFSYRK